MAAKKKAAPKRASKGNVVQLHAGAEFQEDQPRAGVVVEEIALNDSAEGAVSETDAPADAPAETAAAPVADASPGHNSEAVRTARKTAILAAHDQTYDLEKQEEALMKKHIEPLRQARAEIKAALKKDYEITANQFGVAHKLYYAVRDAESGEDWITLQVINEQFDALPMGGQSDLVDIMEKATKQRETQAAAAKKKATTVENVEHTL